MARKDNQKKMMRSKKKFSLPQKRMSFENELAVLKGVVEFSEKGNKPVTYKDIKIPGVCLTNVSSELSFLRSIDFLRDGDKRGTYIPTPQAINFVNNLNWNKEAEAKRILRQMLLKAWFGNLTIRLLKIKELSIEDLISELGKEAMADPKKDRKSIERLIEWLKYAEIIEISEDNKVNLKEAIPTIVEVEKPQIKSVMEKESKMAININLLFLVEVNSQTKKEDIIKIIKTIKSAIQEVERDKN